MKWTKEKLLERETKNSQNEEKKGTPDEAMNEELSRMMMMKLTMRTQMMLE